MLLLSVILHNAGLHYRHICPFESLLKTVVSFNREKRVFTAVILMGEKGVISCFFTKTAYKKKFAFEKLSFKNFENFFLRWNQN